MTNLLYALHVTPTLDAIGIKDIAEETNNDPTLQDLDIIRSGKLYIPKVENFISPKWKLNIPEVENFIYGFKQWYLIETR